MTDSTYYKNEYGGILTEEEFTRHKKAAEAVIRHLLLPRHPADYPGKEDAIRCAVCLQTDELAGHSDSTGLASEALGDYRVEYRMPDVSVHGIRVCPHAMMMLSLSGLLNQWV